MYPWTRHSLRHIYTLKQQPEKHLRYNSFTRVGSAMQDEGRCCTAAQLDGDSPLIAMRWVVSWAAGDVGDRRASIARLCSAAPGTKRLQQAWHHKCCIFYHPPGNFCKLPYLCIKKVIMHQHATPINRSLHMLTDVS